MRTYTCTECSQTKNHEPVRGRLPKVCPECKQIEKEANTLPEIEKTEDGPVDLRIWGGPRGLGTTETPYTFDKGDRVRVLGEVGTTYRVWSTTPSKDGSLTLYGGSLDPRGYQSYRAIMPSRVVPDKRKTFRKTHED